MGALLPSKTKPVHLCHCHLTVLQLTAKCNNTYCSWYLLSHCLIIIKCNVGDLVRIYLIATVYIFCCSGLVIQFILWLFKCSAGALCDMWYPPKTHLELKSRLPMTNFAVVQSFCNFAQGTEVSLSCSLQNSVTTDLTKQMSWRNKISKDLSLFLACFVLV